MGYRNLQACIPDLKAKGKLIEITEPVDPHLELAAIQRRVYQAQGPALLFKKVLGSQFPVLTNLFGTLERANYLFRDTWPILEKFVQTADDPIQAIKKPLAHAKLLPLLLHTFPRKLRRSKITAHAIKLDQIPHLKCWPQDGGAFVTLPQVYSEDVTRPGLAQSNLGMYRIQLSGQAYQANQEIGLHYQIHRSIGVHHQKAIAQNKPFKVNIFIGGAPAMTLAAVMPLPEGLSELGFAGMLAGHRIPMVKNPKGLPRYAEADFCIEGTVIPNKLLPEGPFGDHLGYYSLQHDFPVLQVEAVHHRPNAIWLATSVGRPPQEDTVFGEMIHALTAPLIRKVLPGVQEVHAVDAAGVHPLLLAIGSERYTPYQTLKQPQELLTQAHAILGNGQLSLAKYLLISAHQDNPELRLHDVEGFFKHVLERIDWRRDCHFSTKTTIDTLDYSGTGLNQGSKVVWAAAGPACRILSNQLPALLNLPSGFKEPKLCAPGILAITGPRVDPKQTKPRQDMQSLAQALPASLVDAFPLILVFDDSEFATRHFNHFIWMTFTRSDPAQDIYGVEEFTQEKHWGCQGPLIIDARLKPHHAPPLEDDPSIEKKVEAWGAPGRPLHGIL